MRNNLEEAEDEPPTKVRKVLTPMTTQNPDKGDIEHAIVAIPNTS
jgi:hypothetical protein